MPQWAVDVQVIEAKSILVNSGNMMKFWNFVDNKPIKENLKSKRFYCNSSKLIYLWNKMKIEEIRFYQDIEIKYFLLKKNNQTKQMFVFILFILIVMSWY